MTRPDLDVLAGDADSYVNWPSFMQATVDPSQAARTSDQDRERAEYDQLHDLATRAIEALNTVRALMDERPARHTPGDWHARMDAVLDEAPR